MIPTSLSQAIAALCRDRRFRAFLSINIFAIFDHLESQ